MTCIIGMTDKKNNCVWMGGDSLASNSHTKIIVSQPKIFKSKMLKSVVMGSTGTFRHIDILKYSEDLFNENDMHENIEIDHEYMVTKFIPNVIELFKKGVVDLPETDRGVEFIVGAGNRLFTIQNDYSVLEPALGFCSVGYDEIAMGSMITTKDMDITIPKKIELALRATEKYSCGVQRPFYIINTKDDEVIEIK